MTTKTGLRKMCEWLDIIAYKPTGNTRFGHGRMSMFNEVIDKARSLLAEEQKATDGGLLMELQELDDLVCYHMRPWDGKDIATMPQPVRGYRDIFVKVNKIISRYAQAKPTADKSLIEELKELIGYSKSGGWDDRAKYNIDLRDVEIIISKYTPRESLAELADKKATVDEPLEQLFKRKGWSIISITGKADGYEGSNYLGDCEQTRQYLSGLKDVGEGV